MRPACGYVPVDGELELLPGLRLVPAPGHTRGTQVVVVETGERPVVIGGDMAVWFGELDEPQTEGQLLVRALDPELVWLAHTSTSHGDRLPPRATAAAHDVAPAAGFGCAGSASLRGSWPAGRWPTARAPAGGMPEGPRSGLNERTPPAKTSAGFGTRAVRPVRGGASRPTLRRVWRTPIVRRSRARADRPSRRTPRPWPGPSPRPTASSRTSCG